MSSDVRSVPDLKKLNSITDSEQCAVFLASRHGGQKMRAMVRRRELERRRRRRARHSEDGKKRRSLNIADPGHEMFAQLYSRRSNSVIEISAEGNVQMTSNRSSVYCTLFSPKLSSGQIKIFQLLF